MRPTYAQHASARFNDWLHEVLQRLTADVQRALEENLVALILGGGYGRGEGGIICDDGIERPYNDLDLTLVVRRKRRCPWDRLDEIKKRYETELGIEIDFSRPLTIGDIKRWPHWLMWYDLLHGHVVLAGPPDILTAHAPARLNDPPPTIEATRLLLNRGAGLLWAERIVRRIESPPDDDFVRRNYFKCALALGDALLIVHRRFATPYRGRDARLERLMAERSDVAALELASLYRAALQFKFRPDRAPDGSLDRTRLRGLGERWGAVFLYVERHRTGRAWSTLSDYVRWSGLREPEQHTPVRLVRNVIRNRQLGLWSWRYPREQLYRRLPVLLGLTDASVSDWATETGRFLDIWRRFN